MSEAVKYHLAPGKACGAELKKILAAAAALPGPKVLELEKGTYHFSKADASVIPLAVSNTLARGEDFTKYIGCFFNNISDLTVEGSGALLLFDGVVTAITLKDCRNVTIRNVAVDYTRPRVSEMQVVETAAGYTDFLIHPDSLFTAGEKFQWINADGVPEVNGVNQSVQISSPDGRSNVRTAFNPLTEASGFEMTGERRLRLFSKEPFPCRAGEVWQFRFTLRDAEGIIADNCRDLTFDGMELRFTPGLGVVAQMCENITFRNHRHAPGEDSGRVCAAFADCIQISSCRGRFEVDNSYFSGAQDDPINVHGTYLGVEKVEKNKVYLRFMHNETWGWLPFAPGDEIAFIRVADLARREFRKVAEAKTTGLLTVELTLTEDAPCLPVPSDYSVENISANPEVDIHDSFFINYPTRGILMSSARGGRIWNNTIVMSGKNAGILIAGDSNSWYESGAVADLEIRGNKFCSCRNAAVSIAPEIPDDAAPIHKRITIADNTFENCDPVRLFIRGAEEVTHDFLPHEVQR